jgi:hypothetical protein
MMFFVLARARVAGASSGVTPTAPHHWELLTPLVLDRKQGTSSTLWRIPDGRLHETVNWCYGDAGVLPAQSWYGGAFQSETAVGSVDDVFRNDTVCESCKCPICNVLGVS